MKTIKTIITNTFCTYAVLSLLYGTLCKTEVLVDLPYSDIVFPLFLMSFGTTLFVTIRSLLMSDASRLKYFIDILGCTAIILLINHLVGWMEVSISYFLLICLMVVIVYLFVWFITWLQSKHDEEDLNRLLTKQSQSHKEQK